MEDKQVNFKNKKRTIHSVIIHSFINIISSEDTGYMDKIGKKIF